jgi:predicted phage terminase large subunit-like protein
VVPRVRGDAVCVYDLQVEGNSNFFADQVLVHNCLIIDDPVKNDEEAFSKVYREKAWDWWCGTASTRLEPSGSCVLIMTRWHEDDLAGRLLREDGKSWTVVKLPAIAEATDPLGREEGAALWPERWSVEELMTKKTAAWAWIAEYQQRPAPDEGAIFKRQNFRYFTNSEGTYKLNASTGLSVVPLDTCRRLITVDLAASVKTSADFTVVSSWAVTPKNDLLWLDVRRLRLEGPDQLPLLQRVYEEQKPCTVHIEKVGYQLTLIQQAIRAGLPVRECPVDKDKVSRAIPAAARMESGTVYMKQDAHWLRDCEAELLSFPNAEHDDQVDTLSMAVQDVASHAVPRIRSLS